MKRIFTSVILCLLVLVCGCSEADESNFKMAVDAALNSGDPTQCNLVKPKVPGDTSLFDYCLTRVAELSNDTKSCDYMKNQSKIPGCITGVALNTRNMDLCDRINDSSENTKCKAGVGAQMAFDAAQTAKEKYDELYDLLKGRGAHCENVGVDYTKDAHFTDRDLCFWNTAIKYADTDVCVKMSSNVDDCYEAVAFSAFDKNACKKISSESRQLSCTQQVNSQHHQPNQ